MEAAQTRSAADARRLQLVGALAVVLSILSLLWIGAATNKRACIEKAEAKYPAVAVSAFTGRATGPLKVSFVEERQRAVDDCGLLF